MLTVEQLTNRFETAFDPRQSQVLAEAFAETANGLARSSDLSDLKDVVADLGRTVQDLAAAQQDLAAAQQRTEANLAELTLVVKGLGQDMDDLSRTMKGLGQEMGGMSRSMSYALENEAYRLLPPLLASKYGITLEERLVRTEINGEEINIFAHGTRNGEPILLVGESKLQLDERRNSHRALDRLMDQLERKVAAVKEAYPDAEIVQLLITHYARPAIRERAEREGVILIQSFEW
ncbi:MAG: hypothetical protein KDE19_05880 [Caldilineaceae bacterium]|nr:hypothetical protein [Caldilineaceae bacterium]